MTEFSTITTGKMTKHKAEAALGLNQRSVFDIVRRSDYPTEAAYIKALAETSEAMETPAYQRAAQQAAEEARRRNEEAVRAQQREAFEKIKRGVSLTPMEQQQIDERAAALARDDLAHGKIGASQLGSRIEEHAARLVDAAKSRKATAAQFNAMLRGEV